MAALVLPFWFRTNPINGDHGIMYRAVEPADASYPIPNTYNCEGSRRIGNDFLYNKRSIWKFDRNPYKEYMPIYSSDRFIIIPLDKINVMSDEEKQEMYGRGLIDHYMCFFCDGYYDDQSYWFYPQPEPVAEPLIEAVEEAPRQEMAAEVGLSQSRPRRTYTVKNHII